MNSTSSLSLQVLSQPHQPHPLHLKDSVLSRLRCERRTERDRSTTRRKRASKRPSQTTRSKQVPFESQKKKKTRTYVHPQIGQLEKKTSLRSRPVRVLACFFPFLTLLEAQETNLQAFEVGEDETARSRTLGLRKAREKEETRAGRRGERRGSGIVPRLRENPK